jgi:hypothetical protein
VRISDQIAMKTERARIHLDALNAELKRFVQEPYDAATTDFIEGARFVRRTKVKSIPPLIGMLIGEYLYCLRSGLDQMAWQLATSAAKSNPQTERKICFPIFESLSTKEEKQNWKKIIGCFPSEVAKTIERFQPCQGPGSPKEHELWQLNHLSNFDKHRIIPIHSRSINVFVPDNPAAIVKHLDYADIIEVSVPLSDMGQMDFKPSPATGIDLGDWKTDFLVSTDRLTDIYDFIKDSLMPAFSKFGPEAPISPSIRIAERLPIFRQ